jgi:hypothetical protein
MTHRRHAVAMAALTAVVLFVTLVSCDDTGREPYQEDVHSPNMVIPFDIAHRLNPPRLKAPKRSTIPFHKTARRR